MDGGRRLQFLSTLRRVYGVIKMSDLISTQAVIEALAELVPYVIDDDVTRAYMDGLTDACDLICQLPSVQPEYTIEMQESDIDEATKLVRDARLTILPPAQPERIRGRWYKLTGMMPPEYMGVYFCSNCNEPAMRDWKHHKQTRTAFCPNCGAEMRDTQDA